MLHLLTVNIYAFTSTHLHNTNTFFSCMPSPQCVKTIIPRSSTFAICSCAFWYRTIHILRVRKRLTFSREANATNSLPRFEIRPRITTVPLLEQIITYQIYYFDGSPPFNPIYTPNNLLLDPRQVDGMVFRTQDARFRTNSCKVWVDSVLSCS